MTVSVKLKNERIVASYMNCVNAFARLKVKKFGSDTDQYGPLQAQVAEIKN